MRVLYVEDEKFLADAVKHNLEKNDIDVDHAADGEEGLEKAVSGIYDCVVLDIMLPKLSGIEILERMREKKIAAPVIMLSALDKLQDGDITYNGKSLRKIGCSEFRLKYVNIVFQSYNLIKYMTARENVQVAIDFDKRKVNPDKYLDQVGLTEEEGGRLVNKLSGGQQQRVAIARAIASNSPIIVADEPTGNLDEETEEKIIDIFRELAHEQDKIVIIVTHSKRVAEHADKVFASTSRQA